MADVEKIASINRVIRDYFELHPEITKVPAKDLMPQFIGAGIFANDHRSGLPIHSILRALDISKQLNLLLYVHVERREKNTNWYFVNKIPALRPYSDNSEKAVKPASRNWRRNNSTERDEHYVLNLCDAVIGKKSIRQHRFDFLRGDAGTTLPVDAFYPTFNLAIEYRERQHTERVPHFDKPHILTRSGVHRGEQRKLYDELRRRVLPKHGIKLIEIPYTLFNYDTRKRIIRNQKQDSEIVRKLLQSRAPSCMP